MEEIIKYLTVNWPGLTIFILGVVVLFFIFKTALNTQKSTVDTLKTTVETIHIANQELREEVTALKTKIIEINQCNQTQTLTIKSLKQDITSNRERVESHRKEMDELITQLKKQFDESLDHFSNLSDTVSDLSLALQSLDERQVETWNQVQDILKEHGIQILNIKTLIEQIAKSRITRSKVRARYSDA